MAMAMAGIFSSSTHSRVPVPPPSRDISCLAFCPSISSSPALITNRHKPSLLQMRQIQPPSPSSSLAFALQRCASNGSFREGLQIHARLLRLGLLFGDGTHLFNHLIFLYSSAGRPEAVTALLHLISPHVLSPFFFNTVIQNLSASFPEQVLDIFLHMLLIGLRPNEFTFPYILRSSSLLGLFFLGQQLHAQVLKYGLFPQNIFCATALLDLYSKLAPISHAQQIFDRIPNRNEVTWNSMISALVENELLENGLELLDLMEEDGLEAGVSSWNSLLSGCLRGGNIRLALEILGKMASSSTVSINAATFNTLVPAIPKILSSNSLKELHGFALRKASITEMTLIDKDRLWSAVTAGYAFHELMNYALRLFRNVNLITPHLWIVIINGLLKCSRTHEAFTLFREMTAQCVHAGQTISRALLSLVLPVSKNGLEIHAYAMRRGLESGTSVGNALMAMYSNKGDMDSTLNVFARIAEKDIVSWNTMAASYSAARNFEKAFELFQYMLTNRFEPDEYTYSSVLNGCGQSSHLGQAITLHGRMIKTGLSQSFMVVQNSLMDAYGKCGCTSYARNVFEAMDSRDIISWNTIISCYGFSNSPHEAFIMFERMKAEGLKPTRVTFVALLSACSHAGMLREGLHYFETMSKEYGIMPDVRHYACLVDNMGRIGELERAFELVRGMPIEPDDCVWSALLNSCRIHGDVELAEVAASNLIALKPHHSGYWVLLSNVYADAFKWDDVANVRSTMKDGGVKKSPGWSWIEVGKGEVHSFLTADISHKNKVDIYDSVDGLTMQLKDEGYVPGTYSNS